MTRRCRYLIHCLRNSLHIMHIRSRHQYDEKHLQYMLVRSIHGLEKGLCLPEVRLGFGIQKIEKLCRDIKEYYDRRYDTSHPAIDMALSTLAAYFAFHDEKGYVNDDVLRCKDAYKRIEKIDGVKDHITSGGILYLQKSEVSTISPEEFQSLVRTRHSIRDFCSHPVPLELIQDAVNDAMRCPSACNRQPTKVYVVTKEKRDLLLEDLKGIGGFSEYVEKFLVIAGDITAFDANEDEQWIVNAGIFAGYLTLALHVRGVASCAIQRNLHWGRTVKRTQARLGIPPNEQIVMLLAVGLYPENMRVPVSHRYDATMIMKEI